MRATIIMCIWLIALPIWAGTFKDNFDDNNLAGWTKLINNGEVKVEDGKVVVTDFGFGLTTGITFNNGQIIGDFTLSFDGKMVRRIDNSQDYMCVWARDVEGKGFTWASYHPMNDMRLNLYDGNFNCVDMNKFPIAFELDKWYHLEVKMNGGKMTFSIDGDFSKERDWSGWQQLADKGEVGIGAGGAEVHFDNFVITGDEVPDNLSVMPAGRLTATWGKIKAY